MSRETKEEIAKVFKSVYAVQREMAELKTSFKGGMVYNAKDMELTQNSVDQLIDFMGPNKRSMPIINRPDIEDSQDMDSDDEIRKKLLSSRSDERDLLMTKDELSNNFEIEEPIVIPKLEDVKLSQSQMDLEELTESDLKQIVAEIVELDDVYQSGDLTID